MTVSTATPRVFARRDHKNAASLSNIEQVVQRSNHEHNHSYLRYPPPGQSGFHHRQQRQVTPPHDQSKHPSNERFGNISPVILESTAMSTTITGKLTVGLHTGPTWRFGSGDVMCEVGTGRHGEPGSMAAMSSWQRYSKLCSPLRDLSCGCCFCCKMR